MPICGSVYALSLRKSVCGFFFFFFNDTATTEIYTLHIVGSVRCVQETDLIQAILLSCTKESAVGGRFLISGPEHISWKQFYSYFENMIKKESVITMQMAEIKTEIARRNKQNSTFSQIKSLLEKNETIDFLLKLPLIKTPYGFLKKFIPENKRKKMRKRITTTSFKDNESNTTVIVDDLAEYKMLNSRGIANIKKAVSILGYSPQYSIETGMKSVEQWARWANLIPQRLCQQVQQ
eukprot:TRINITY_DN16952_c0_g1_i2.p2 TRINITY_DN16952_c0_g1~~TRINITY_DN16952_c0_g1_i2.p2  ORF type:complete len:236 (+),score=38.36 TRINITY_DN16952_c0_g1_i2:64-771(+)